MYGKSKICIFVALRKRASAASWRRGTPLFFGDGEDGRKGILCIMHVTDDRGSSEVGIVRESGGGRKVCS